MQNNLPFYNHPQFPVLVDILLRKEKNNVILISDFNKSTQEIFLKSFSAYLNNLNYKKLLDIELKNIDSKDKKSNQRYILFKPVFELKMLHDENFDYLFLNKLCSQDLILLLKEFRLELEKYHQVLIPEECLLQAYMFVERYLSVSQLFEKTKLLLDTAAAKLQRERKDQPQKVLTLELIMETLSELTAIPTACLLMNKFTMDEFILNLNQLLFGQAIAIQKIAQGLAKSYALLQKKSGPFCSLLFFGPAFTGKKYAAELLTLQLFKQKKVLFYMQFLENAIEKKLSDYYVRDLENKVLSLHQAINLFPYAVFLLQDIDKASPSVINELHDLLNSGYLYHEQSRNDFHQAIIILTTNMGGESLLKVSDPPKTESLVLTKLLFNSPPLTEHLVEIPEEKMQAAVAALENAKLTSLLEACCLIPFVPTDPTAIEKRVTATIEQLLAQLQSRYEIILQVTPEVIRFLTAKIIQDQAKNNGVVDIEKILNQTLYTTVEKIIILPRKNLQALLRLHLDETGELLRCDWVLYSEMSS